VTQVLILAISIVIPSTALVLVARQYFSYQARKAEAAGAQRALYQELAERVDRHTADVAGELTRVHQRLQAIESLLRSVD